MRFPYLGHTFSIVWLFICSVTRDPKKVVNLLFLIYCPTAYYLIKNSLNLSILDECFIWSHLFLSFSINKFLLNH